MEELCRVFVSPPLKFQSERVLWDSNGVGCVLVRWPRRPSPRLPPRDSSIRSFGLVTGPQFVSVRTDPCQKGLAGNSWCSCLRYVIFFIAHLVNGSDSDELWLMNSKIAVIVALVWFSEQANHLLRQPVEVSKLIKPTILLPFWPVVHIVKDSEVFWSRFIRWPEGF